MQVKRLPAFHPFMNSILADHGITIDQMPDITACSVVRLTLRMLFYTHFLYYRAFDARPLYFLLLESLSLIYPIAPNIPSCAEQAVPLLLFRLCNRSAVQSQRPPSSHRSNTTVLSATCGEEEEESLTSARSPTRETILFDFACGGESLFTFLDKDSRERTFLSVHGVIWSKFCALVTTVVLWLVRSPQTFRKIAADEQTVTF